MSQYGELAREQLLHSLLHQCALVSQIPYRVRAQSGPELICVSSFDGISHRKIQELLPFLLLQPDHCLPFSHSSYSTGIQHAEAQPLEQLVAAALFLAIF